MKSKINLVGLNRLELDKQAMSQLVGAGVVCIACGCKQLPNCNLKFNQPHPQETDSASVKDKSTKDT